MIMVSREAAIVWKAQRTKLENAKGAARNTKGETEKQNAGENATEEESANFCQVAVG